MNVNENIPGWREFREVDEKLRKLSAAFADTGNIQMRDRLHRLSLTLNRGYEKVAADYMERMGS